MNRSAVPRQIIENQETRDDRSRVAAATWNGNQSTTRDSVLVRVSGNNAGTQATPTGAAWCASHALAMGAGSDSVSLQTELAHAMT